MSRIKILIADDIEETRKVIGKILHMEEDKFELVGQAANGQEVLEMIPKCEPDIVLMDINMPVMNGLEAAEKISDRYPSVMIIIMSVQAENEYLKRAMFSGAKEYIIKPFNSETLVNTVQATYEKYKDKVVHKQLAQEDKNAKVITCYSAKGGVGKSVIAANSAVISSQIMNKKTLLIDMDLQFGDISMLMNKHREKTIYDMVDEGQFETYEGIKPYLCEYNKNLDILLAPRNPESSEYIGKDVVEKVIKILKKRYDVILIDTAVDFQDVTLYILDVTDVILLISTLEISALKNTKLCLGVMQSINYDQNKVKIVVNGATNKYGISEKDIHSVFRDTVFATIPEDLKTVRTSVNMGTPFCAQPKSKREKIVKFMKKMCENLID